MATTSILLLFVILASIAGILAMETQRVSNLRQRRLAWLLRRNGNYTSAQPPVTPRRVLKKIVLPETGVACVILLVALILNLPVLLTLAVLCTACAGVWFGMRAWRRNKIRKEFSARFPDAVDNLTRAVQAGIPVEKALGAIGESYDGELGKRFSLMVRHLELGAPFRDAAAAFSESLNMPDVDFFCAVLALNRENGNRLSPMLMSLSKTLRERHAVNRKLKALTSETRSTAKILSILPLVVLAVQFILNPRLFNFLLYDSLGQLILAGCGFSMLAGILIINRMSYMGDAR